MSKLSTFIFVGVFAASPFAMRALYETGYPAFRVVAGVLLPVYGLMFLSLAGCVWKLSNLEGWYK